MPVLAVLAMLATSLLATQQRVAAQQQSQDFLEFSADQVPDPAEMMQALSRLGIQPAPFTPDWMKRIQEQGGALLEGLSPEQQQQMAELVNDYLADRGLKPEDLIGKGGSDLADDLGRQLGGQLQNDPELQQRLTELQESLRTTPPWGERPAQPPSGDPSTIPGGGQADGDETSPEGFDDVLRQLQQLNPGGTQPGSSAPNEVPRIPGRVPRGNSSNDRPSTDQGSPGGPPGNGDRSGGSRSDPNRANPSRPPERPESDTDRPRPNPADARKRTTPPPPVPKKRDRSSDESIGVQFDRLLMDVAQRGLEATDSESASSLRQTVDSVFDHLLDSFESAMAERSRNENRRSFEANAFSLPNRSRGGRLSALEMGREGIRTVLAWLLGFGVLVAAAWLLWRWQVIAQDPERLGNGLAAPRYRHRKIRSAAELVRAFDRFILSRFGMRATWWNVRRAMQLMRQREFRAVSDERLEELVSVYERARYSGARDVDVDRMAIDRAAETLGELASERNLLETAGAEAL